MFSALQDAVIISYHWDSSERPGLACVCVHWLWRMTDKVDNLWTSSQSLPRVPGSPKVVLSTTGSMWKIATDSWSAIKLSRRPPAAVHSIDNRREADSTRWRVIDRTAFHPTATSVQQSIKSSISTWPSRLPAVIVLCIQRQPLFIISCCCRIWRCLPQWLETKSSNCEPETSCHWHYSF